MSHMRDEDRLDALISQAVDLGKVEFDRRKWLDRLAAQPQKPSPTGTRVDDAKSDHPWTTWRRIMDSRIAKYSAAAVVMLAAARVLLNPLGTVPNGVALAQVQAKIAQVDTMILRGETTFTSVADPNTIIKYDNTKYLSRQEGLVEDGFIKGIRIYRVVLSKCQKQGVLLLDPWKKCVRFPCTEEQIRIVERLTPSGVVDLLLESNNYRKLGTENIDGVEAEGFELQDLKPLVDIVPAFLMDLQQGTATIWVGTKELLPIRMEADMLLGKTIATLFMDVKCHEIAVLEKYDVELDPGLFDTATPEGYTEFTLTESLAWGRNLRDDVMVDPKMSPFKR